MEIHGWAVLLNKRGVLSGHTDKEEAQTSGPSAPH